MACLVIYTVAHCFCVTPDEDVKKYNERQKKAAEAPVQVDEVDSCLPRTRVGLTLEDDPNGLDFLLGFSFKCINTLH